MPPYAGVFYIRSTWQGDRDHLGANSTIQKLTVVWAHLSTHVVIVSGANAEVDRTPNATVTFAVNVVDENNNVLKGVGTVEFYVSDYSHHNIIFAGSDNDTAGTGVYQIQWKNNATVWPYLGPCHWSAWFTGTPQYNASLASTNFTIFYYGATLWVNPTFQAVNVTQSTTYTVNFQWIHNTQNNFSLSLNGLNPSWYTLSQTNVTVNAQEQTKQVTLTVSPPQAPTILTDYDFNVTATNATGFSVSAAATLRVEFEPTVPALPTGGLAIAVQPKTIQGSAGASTSINILVVNNENFGDSITIDITDLGISTSYQANLTWFSWTEITVFIPAGGRIYIPLDITLPTSTATGTHVFKALATSTSILTRTATDSGIIKDPDPERTTLTPFWTRLCTRAVPV
jgi:hypothetical protein